jgi:hypothetical protein
MLSSAPSSQNLGAAKKSRDTSIDGTGRTFGDPGPSLRGWTRCGPALGPFERDITRLARLGFGEAAEDLAFGVLAGP